ncbi:mitochondrial tRNA pseudouridine(32) synthase [Podospora australis]|uniref:Mitochondrial tRNA pseudouridine(32) synthase n=1 Tax=Podospora australis TaxID=1536484 RepID=A0AAN7AL39_9PEZI|nr:mitochondrial tRNA pseudouridine(32) synthase [Podospora australis]
MLAALLTQITAKGRLRLWTMAPSLTSLDPECDTQAASNSTTASVVTVAKTSVPILPVKLNHESEIPSAVPPPPTLFKPIPPEPRAYYFEDGLRRVAPYFYTYNTWCKERWRGRQLIEVFESEFRDRPLEYYRAAMEAGQVAINGKTVGPDYVLVNGDLVSHTTHRHEPPVTAEPIRVIHEDDGMVVINKPSGVPVHPAGRYHYNSVMEIMKAERGPDFVPRPCNRLDRLTSGIMFVAKNAEAAGRLGVQIFQRSVRKEYLARVVGRFPDGEVVCDQPILQISPKLGLNRVRANGKASRTVFKRLAYYPPTATDENGSCKTQPDSNDSNTERTSRTLEGYSIVRCLPVTGRTHQIRVHLQFLGHPIQNDPIYANQKVWGLDLGCNDADAVQNTDEDVISRLSRVGKDQVAEAVAYYDEMVDEYHKKKAEKMSGETCPVCDTPLYTDPGGQELSLWLHSLRYEDADGSWSYVSPLPAWALPPEGKSGPTQVGALDDLVVAAGDMDIE